MIVALLVAIPFFPATFNGPICADPAVAGRCSECMTWTPSAGAEWYEVRRELASATTTWCIAGKSRAYDATEDGINLPRAIWCAAWDGEFGGVCGFPQSGTLYRYSVRACNAYGCSAYSPHVEYRGTPYDCYDTRWKSCYVGDLAQTR